MSKRKLEFLSCKKESHVRNTREFLSCTSQSISMLIIVVLG